MHRRYLLQGLLASLGATGMRVAPAFASPLRVDPSPPSIVGAWRLLTTGTPEQHHTLTFNGDGIVTSFQADAGDPTASVSTGAGTYQLTTPGKVRGVFVEDLYRRDTHTYLGYVRVEFVVAVEENLFSGAGHAQVFDPSGTQISEAFPTFAATRITL